MPTTTPGHFVWYDLITSDPAGAKKFYTDLLDWRYENFGQSEVEYPMIKAGEAFIGGIAGQGDLAAFGPPRWTAYVSVDDVDTTCARVEELGGKVIAAPTDIPEVGRFAVIADPHGATIAPFKSLNPPAPAPDTTPDGTFCWNECLTVDSASAADFYRELFGWRVEANEMQMGGATTRYHVFLAGEKMLGGAMDLPPPAIQAGAPPHWLYYIKVADVDALAKKAAELGGAVACPPNDIPDTGRFCVVTDPQGAMIALFKPLARA